MKVQIANDLKQYSDAELTVFSFHVTTSMNPNINPYFPSTIPALSTVDAAANALIAFLDAHKKGDKTQTKNDLRDALENLINSLGKTVEIRANNPLQGEDPVVIAQSTGMHLKDKTHPQKRTFSVRRGKDPGTLIATAESERKDGAVAHEWRFTYDPTLQNWTHAPSTSEATTLLDGLTSEKRCFVSHRPVKRTPKKSSAAVHKAEKGGPEPWSEPKSELVP
ncbi:MAG: hypothetical protein HY063_01480 [Bacteroidetes bacterium]|nr:hypothetical protein [Bacteroidota bacterium]